MLDIYTECRRFALYLCMINLYRFCPDQSPWFIIMRRCPRVWPARRPDLNPTDKTWMCATALRNFETHSKELWGLFFSRYCLYNLTHFTNYYQLTFYRILQLSNSDRIGKKCYCYGSCIGYHADEVIISN